MSTIDLPRVLPYQPVRLSVERYHELTRIGAFSENDAVELLEGVVTEKTPKNPLHCAVTRSCDLALSKLVANSFHVQNQEPITLARSEPEPDMAIVRGQLEQYRDRHPIAEDVVLIIEVSDTTLITDRFKTQLYAEAGIPICWIVNLAEPIIEVYSHPLAQAKPPH